MQIRKELMNYFTSKISSLAEKHITLHLKIEKGMKKALATAMLAVTLCLLTACDDSDQYGKVNYQLGASALKLYSSESLKRWEKIEKYYKTALAEIDGATVLDGGTSIQMEGVYTKTDAAVKAACEKAEKDASSITISDGYIVMEVSATYWSGATREVIYTHTFGQP